MNDGSKDESLDILDRYAVKDSRIRVFSKENEGKGAASARNMGLEHAVGKYVQFLDSDDFFEPDMIETLVNKAIATAAEVVICRGQIFDDAIPVAASIRLAMEVECPMPSALIMI